MRWLCIEANLLVGRYYGRRDDGRRAEWPPNPHRLYQALLAAANLGYRRTEFSDAKKEAFRWLESRPLTPEILAPEAHKLSAVRLYVPNNDMDKVAAAWVKGTEPDKSPSELRTDKDLRPHYLEGDATVRFLWPINDDEWEVARPHAEMLCAEARHLHALGLGIDLVAGNGRILTDAEKQALPGEVYVADMEGKASRIPKEGSLDELMERHAVQRKRVAVGARRAEGWLVPPAPPTVFREVEYRSRSTPRRRRVHAFTLVDGDGDFCSFDPRDAILVAAWLRHAAHQRARALNLDADFVERFVCGHGTDTKTKDDRLSYLPLPTISAKGRDGRIRRALLAEPVAGHGDGEALSIARRLDGASLVSESTGKVTANLRALGSPFDGVTARYLEKSVQWATVTPTVLPGRDDRRARKAYGLVLKALVQAGWTMPVAEIHLQPEPIFPGAEMAWRYRVPRYLREFPRLHAIITFAQPIAGPLAIGGGRHIGLGIFASL